ncbi:hypothetical protein PHLGIDRAFT_35277 [Phlebiopsis gigantea 11061_1 CR5-6]|uniref:F-box domain-containing protein n=1 Tax=Phlebiopsis gigantea (strain 11061_1 CR5-6) TaxID=745531 RepID=A0A0C3S8Z3_PHLG1|nr:hypothetical protein PHLGIDRAFT_35277 [Phlebiopsis gigantea 11061_1 CR5-6]
MAEHLSMLPYDILRILVRLVSAADIAQLFSTCRKLYSYMKDEAIWRELCAHYGVATRDMFPDATFFEIYSGILHKYGPLLGLWASDHPYFGSIVEFRLDVSAHCISGELWQFYIPPRTRAALIAFATMSDSPNDEPSLPKPCRLLTITLPSTPTPRRAHLLWHIDHSIPLHNNYDGAVPTLRVLSQTDESLYICDNSGDASRLPEFPDPHNRPWYDSDRGLPRLKVEPAPTSCTQDPLLVQSHLVFVYMARTEAMKPAAISICPSVLYPIDVFAPHEPLLTGTFEDSRTIDISKPHPADAEPIFHRRFYPLRLPAIAGCDPSDEDWRPSCLEGLWLGTYRTHETEVLYVYVDELEREVRAMKITGNVNIPRGAITWSFRLDNRVRPHDLPLDNQKAQLAFGGELARMMMYRGTGSTSATGYAEEDREEVNIFVGIVGPDEIRINWYGMDGRYTPRYLRYKGRDIDGSSESCL